MLREMSTSYGRSPEAMSGPSQSLSRPLLSCPCLFRGLWAPPIGISFPLFYATGMVPFVMFNDLHNKVAQALMYSKPLLAYPNVTFLDALLARFVLICRRSCLSPIWCSPQRSWSSRAALPSTCG